MAPAHQGPSVRTTVSRKSSEGFIQRLVRRSDFELARAMIMILDAVLVVWEMQDASNRSTSSFHSNPDGINDTVFFTVLLDMSCVLFVLDLYLRLAAGHFDPIKVAGKGWQTFQVVVVIAQLLQAIGQHTHRHQRSHSGFRVVLAMFSTLRLARVLSLVMVTDVTRQHRSFRELRSMVLSLTGAVKAMVWSSLLVFIQLRCRAIPPPRSGGRSGRGIIHGTGPPRTSYLGTFSAWKAENVGTCAQK